MTDVQSAAPLLEAQVDHVYYDADKKPWACVQLWHHPKHRHYHVAWTGDYAIMQEYGNYKDPIQVVPIEEFAWRFSLAWAPMTVCRFCGFTRMSPCQKRQTCPNLSDRHLEPPEPRDDAEEDERSKQTEG